MPALHLEKNARQMEDLNQQLMATPEGVAFVLQILALALGIID